MGRRKGGKEGRRAHLLDLPDVDEPLPELSFDTFQLHKASEIHHLGYLRKGGGGGRKGGKEGGR